MDESHILSEFDRLCVDGQVFYDENQATIEHADAGLNVGTTTDFRYTFILIIFFMSLVSIPPYLGSPKETNVSVTAGKCTNNRIYR